ATNDGLAHYDGRGLSFIGSSEGMRGGVVWDLAFDRSGNLWFGTGSAIVGGGLGACRTFTTADGLANNGVRAIVSDRFGNVWLGTRGGGVSRWDGRGFANFGTAQGLGDDDVYALLVRRNGELVIGNAQHGATICALPDLRPCRTLRKGNGLAVDAVIGLDEDVEGNLWIGVNNGLSKLVSEKLLSFDDRHGVPGPGGYSLLPEVDGDVWVGTFGGLGRMRLQPPYEPPLMARWDAESGLPSSEVWDVVRDRRGQLW